MSETKFKQVWIKETGFHDGFKCGYGRALNKPPAPGGSET